MGWVRATTTNAAVALALLGAACSGPRPAASSTSSPPAQVTVTVSASAAPSDPPTTEATPDAPPQRYLNPRYGFGVTVPAGWVAQRPPDNGDGQVFTSPDGAATLTASGSNNVGAACDGGLRSGGDTVSGCLTFERARLVAGGASVTYEASGSDWLVLSGYLADGRIYYQRQWIGPGSMDRVDLTYPADQKGVYDPVLEQVVAGFRPGDLQSPH